MDFDCFINIDNLSKSELKSLLLLKVEEDINKLSFTANQIRDKFLSNEVKFCGMIEISNICDCDCLYCGLRKSNNEITRYKMNAEEVISTARQIINLGINKILIQSGDDSTIEKDYISYIIYSIKQYADVSIILSLGERSIKEYEAWKISGADSYLLKFETSNSDLYSKIHTGYALAKRIESIKNLKKIGYRLGTGNLIGIKEQTTDDLINDLIILKDINPDFLVCSPFIPAPNTPFASDLIANKQLTLNFLATARIFLKNIDITATTSLDSIEKNGRELGLEFGANVVMQNFTPNPYRKHYQVYPSERHYFTNPIESLSSLKLRIENAGRRTFIKN